MHQYMIRNATPFPMQKLQVTKGSIPKSILGSYIKNGPGLYTIADQVLPHWFMGDAGMLKVQFHDGDAYAMYKMVETPAYKRDIAENNFNRQNVIVGAIKNLVGMNGNNDEVSNSASTSILRLPNSDKFYALYEGGLPFGIQQKSMKEKGFESFDFIRKGFSAHPKIDPDNGDIFNIGFNVQTFDVYRMTKDLKLLAKNTINLRVPQSIHDCCLAGDYLVVFQCPVKLDKWKLLKGYFALKCYSADYDYGKTVAWIFKKQNLELVKKVQLTGPEVFLIYHFTNGYVDNKKLIVQYVKYPGQNAQKILDLVDYVPNYSVKGGQKQHFNLFTELETVQINLEDFSYKFHTKNFDCEFPLCEDHEVGKKWQYSYFIAKDKKGNEFFQMDRLMRYDRINDKTLQKHYPGCCIVEPSLIRTSQGLFVLVLVSSPQKCWLEILNGEKFQIVASIDLPEHVPFGFHGKWLGMQSKEYLETALL